MSKLLIFFALWCFVLLGAAAVAGWAAWDPFADASGHHQGPGDYGHHGGHGGFYGGFYGPAHK